MTFDSATHLPGWFALLQPAGQDALAFAAKLSASGTSSVQVQQKMRAEIADVSLVAAALGQHDLRKKAAGKFGAELASKLLFTPTGLEQATRGQVARHHAARFASAGITEVADLGCGIGAESIALLRAGISVVAWELDELTAAFAAHNLALVASETNSAREKAGLPPVTAEVVCGDVSGFNAADFMAGSAGDSALFFDPARRTLGNRNSQRVQPQDYSPHLDFVFALAEKYPAAIKLGPGFPREMLPENADCEWVSCDRQAVETLVWTGALREKIPAARKATVFTGEQQHALTADSDWPDPEVTSLGAYIYEPDPAVIRARQIGQLAGLLGTGLLSENIAYLTGNTTNDSPFAQGFRVLEVLPLRDKAVREALQRLGAARVEIKKRGVDIDPADFRKKLKLKPATKAASKSKTANTTGEITVFLTRIAGDHSAIITQRI
ncbi:MAG: class I SAM-dependent methyltransferase [Microbacteriaceae bacterium]|nr:class I SAM-dependent methyltransferase [Microbacteriaceae bacterium]